MRGRISMLAGLLLTATWWLAAAQDPESPSSPTLTCVDPAMFTFVTKVDGTRRDWKLYFRGANEEHWYYVEMKRLAVASPLTGEPMFRALLPKPRRTTARIEYRIDWKTPGDDYELADVLVGGCPEETTNISRLSVLPDGQKIVVRPASDQPDIPPLPVLSFENEAEDMVPPDDSSNWLLIAGLVAAGGGAATAGVLARGDETINIIGPPPQLPPIACFVASPPVAEITQAIRFDASCTTGDQITLYSWTFGNDGGISGPTRTVQHAFSSPGFHEVTLVVTNSAGETKAFSSTVEVQANPEARIETDPSPPSVVDGMPIRFDGSSSLAVKDETGREGIVSYVWNFGDNTGEREQRIVSRVFPRPGVYGVRLTVTNEFERTDDHEILVQVLPANASTTESGDTARRPVRIALTSHLDTPPADGSVRAHVSLNGRAAGTIDNATPRRLALDAITGTNTIEGVVTGRAAGEGRFRFELTGAHRPVPGTLEVEHGHVVSLDASSVVFRLSGATGQRIRFHFDLAAPR